ncbi:MAG: hypothetical protein BAW33_09140 [Desulfobacterales bacterium C00003104]|jgi:hypothetical protein|nr:MAG: hypothetical protein BAW33_09140 [Desulfobacterales bacterium C00003104]
MFFKKADTIVGVSLILSLFIVGCATSEKNRGDLSGADTVWKKKIVVLPFADLPGYEAEELGLIATRQFRQALVKDCKGLVVEDEKRGRHLEALVRTPEGMGSMQVTRVARALGLNAILTGELPAIKTFEQKEGIWPFRKIVPAVSLELEVRLYDVETRAILLSERAKASTKIPEALSQSGDQHCDFEVVTRLLQEAVHELSRRVCGVMKEEPFKGYVISLEGDKVEISAGADTGLHKGDVLKVFGWEPPLEGKDGQVFLISGPCIGEIKVEEVFQHTSIAEVISGVDLDKSNCVKAK